MTFLSAAEKRGGALISPSKCGLFQNRTNSRNLMELGYSGYKYTWRGPISHGGLRIYERLDRGLSNDQWRIQFLNAQVKVLTQLDFSDHHPLLVALTENNTRQFPYHFKLENYHAVVQAGWKDYLSLNTNLEELKKPDDSVEQE